MNEIDCKIVLEEYVLLHEAYENQEFKRLLLELEYGGASACEEGKALLNQAKPITSQPLQVSKCSSSGCLRPCEGIKQARSE